MSNETIQPAETGSLASPAAQSSAPASESVETKVRDCGFRATLTALTDLQGRLKKLLLEPGSVPSFKDEIIRASTELCEIVAGNPDASLFHLMHESAGRFAIYSVTHALQCAVVCKLVAERMEWSSQQRDSLVYAALTMNIGMAKLQGELAMQSTPPSPAQRREIDIHPQKSVDLLQKLGISDSDWLRAVQEHHGAPDSKGAAPFELAALLRQIDIFMAKLQGRSTRKSIPVNKAVRDMFAGNRDSRIANAVIKVFGLYPPGIFVLLANGETAIVVARGEAVDKPIVEAIASKFSDASFQPVRRDTVDPRFKVVSIVNQNNVMTRVDPARL